MMVHHDIHHPPFTSSSSSSIGAASAVVNGWLGLGGAGEDMRTLHTHQLIQSLASSASASLTSGMGLYPFTQTQWRELERQAVSYKHMVASVPVPHNLLFPVGSHYSLAGGRYGLRFGNGDPEPGRCRRTDGKKWRCARDAAPDQKYCDRHLNRGRPRSRKPVEVNSAPRVSPNKKTRHFRGSNANPPSSSASDAAVAVVYNKPPSHHSNQTPLLPHRSGCIDVPNIETRGLDWLMIGEPHTSEETLGLNSSYNTDVANQFNESIIPLGNSDVISSVEPQRTFSTGFIDAWSENNSKPSSSISPHDEKFSLSSEPGHIQMGLGAGLWTRTDSTTGLNSWLSSAPGGPLGEVF